jgi:hypothetical protein
MEPAFYYGFIGNLYLIIILLVKSENGNTDNLDFVF